MKTLWLTIVAFVIAVSASAMDMRGTVYFETDQMTTGPQIKDVIQTESFFSPAERYSKNSNLIAQGFFPIVIIAESSDITHHFAHYLPLYNLNRQKEYFLLI